MWNVSSHCLVILGTSIISLTDAVKELRSISYSNRKEKSFRETKLNEHTSLLKNNLKGEGGGKRKQRAKCLV